MSLKTSHQKSSVASMPLKRWARDEVANQGPDASEAEKWLRNKAARLHKLSPTKAKKLGKK